MVSQQVMIPQQAITTISVQSNTHNIQQQIPINSVAQYQEKLNDNFLNLEFALRKIKNLLDTLNGYYKIFYYSTYLKELYQHYILNKTFLDRIRLDNSKIILYTNEYKILIDLVNNLKSKRTLIGQQKFSSKYY